MRVKGKVRVKGKESSERGAALVEAAASLLILLILIFGMFEAGRILNIQQTLTNAAREGARLSVLPAWGGTSTLPSTTAVQARVQSFLNASGMNGATATVNVVNNHCPGCPGNTTHYSLVTVTVPYRVVSISMFKFMEVNLEGQAMMRNETNNE